MRILLVEDDLASVEVLTRYLLDQHYAVDTASDGESGWRYASTYEYDLLVLDVVLPQLDGISLCQRLRADGNTTPIMLLTAQDSSTAKIIGLDAGADDYVAKPFDPAEWIARVRALLRRGSSNPLPILTWGQLWLNPSTCEVTYDGRFLTLSSKEYALLELLLRESQHVFSNEEILESLWSSDEFPVEATVRSHMRRLRHKLVEVGAPSDLISTAYGRGYYLKPIDSLSHTPAEPSSSVTPEPTEIQVQYQDMLQTVWTESQPRIQEHLKQIMDSLELLAQNLLTPDLQQIACHTAHTLAGTLGTLGQLTCMQQAQELEQGLHPDIMLEQGDAPSLKHLVQNLSHSISRVTFHPSSNNGKDGNSLETQLKLPAPLIIQVDPEETNHSELIHSARQTGFQIERIASYQQALIWLAEYQAGDRNPLAGLILGLPSQSSSDLSFWKAAIAVLEVFLQNYPTLPTVILASNLNWSDRLDLIRRGGKCILPRSTSFPSLLEPLQRLHVPEQNGHKRVMLVDDDPVVLRTLPSQLQPFGLEVSTLNDPQQFWNLLEVVQPHALVLDVRMPSINGLELCQVLRSDPQWQKVPILFLSVATDDLTQSEAFAVGADDFLCKPVSGGELASRILSRLRRIQAWRSA